LNIDNFAREDRIIGGISLVLAIDLIAFPWFSPGFGFTFVGTDSPDSLLGVLGFIAAIVLLADVVLEVAQPNLQLPSIGGSRATTRLAVIGVIVVTLALKFLLQISHFSDLGWGFWLAAVLVGGLVYSALQGRRA
jgi:hypothetical protein